MKKIPFKRPPRKSKLKSYQIELTEYHPHEDAYKYYMDGDILYTKNPILTFNAESLSMAFELIKHTPYKGRLKQLDQEYE